MQRVSQSEVSVAGKSVGKIGKGILVLLGVEKGDTKADADKLIKKLLALRIFPDEDDKMNLNITDINGGLLVVSQFTLAADTRKGTRPGFSTAAPPDIAKALYDYTVSELRVKHAIVETGIFAADMQVSLVNDGPVTFLLETQL
ncbi:D-aminoacyl-tRNA deacylase [Marinibactrum halimedae]|uniref:D-aminoacyl-tRNA deacylase n=1 Tax=Marinibactrum halimedae TaxID=1444977 RepID=A0AA37T985_9GAMM|nr:D-aminoacyl-tRNA deacylase [Marinibactrum halimedae]